MVNLMESSKEESSHFPFAYATETSSADFTPSRYEAFLKDQGVLDEGMWKAEGINHKRPKYGALKYDDAWVLPSESVTFDCACAEPEQPIKCWREFYQHRQLSLTSPAAILMTYVMTLYYVMTSLFDIAGKDSLIVHVVGAEKESDLIPTFMELQYLLPSVRLKIVLIGPSLSRRACDKTHYFNSVTVSLKKGFYHELWTKMEERPDLLIGFNAGLAAYPAWLDTLKLIRTERLCAFFTDYCVESCDYTRNQLDSRPGLQAKMNGLTLNPFRSPVRIYDSDSQEPRFSNHYVYSIQNG